MQAAMLMLLLLALPLGAALIRLGGTHAMRPVLVPSVPPARGGRSRTGSSTPRFVAPSGEAH